MLKANLLRILRASWQSFVRNLWLSTATVAVMVLALLMIGLLALFNVMTQTVIKNLENRVDVSVYFYQDTEEEKILSIRQELLKLPEVKSVDYVSQEEALARFKERHKDSDVLMQSLQELDTNPLEGSLNIKANHPSQYETIANYFNEERFKGLIDKINYKQNKDVIERLTNLTGNIEKGGWAVSLALAMLAILVSFNTVRLTMYIWREEISVMRLVGASNWFIRGPFVTEGILYGLVSAIFTLIFLYPLLWLISGKITSFLPSVDLLYFYKANFWQFVLLIVGVGVLLGGISSLIAIRRYLKA